MNISYLEVPLSIFAAGCIIFHLAALGSFSPLTSQAMCMIGLSIELIGIVAGLIAFSRHTMKEERIQDN